MKTRLTLTTLALVVSLLTVGCNTFKATDGYSQLLDVQKRAILVGGNETIVTPKESGTIKTITNVKICAEPSPDAMSASAFEAAAKGGVPSKVSVELSTALQESAAFVGLRTTSIQLLRDFGYRLCEAHLSGAITEPQYDLLMRRFQKNVVALLAIEQLTGPLKAPPVVLTAQGRAETSQTLSEQRDVREKISNKIAELEKDKKDLESKKADALKANASADTKELDSQISDKEAEIKRRKADLEAIDKGIASARGSLAEGKTESVIKTEGLPQQRQDVHIEKVAAIVGDIVMAIVKSDDTHQICLLTLASSIDPSNKSNASRLALADWCQKEMELDHTTKNTYFTIQKNTFETAKPALTSTVPGEKQKAEKDIEQARRNIETLLKGQGVYDYAPTK